MIGINNLYLLVNNDIARKDHAGYTSTDEFNRVTNLLQGLLFDFYIEKNDGRAKEALRPFVKEASLNPVTGGTEYYDLPDDYRQKLDVGLETISSAECDGDPVFVKEAANHLDYDEELLIRDSVIRGTQKAYSIVGEQIKIRPSTFIGRVYIKYYQNPPDAERAFTLDVGTQEEVYNPAGTTDLIWPESEISNFVDLHLIYKGISTRITELTQWAVMKQRVELLTAVNND